MTRAIADQARTVRIPVHMVETINKFVRIQRELNQELLREPTEKEIINRLDPKLSVKRLREILRLYHDPISLEKPIISDEDSNFGDFIEDKEILSPEKRAHATALTKELDQIFSEVLTEKEEDVVRRRTGMQQYPSEHTLEEVGESYGLTRERIRQVEFRGYEKLSSDKYKKRLYEF